MKIDATRDRSRNLAHNECTGATAPIDRVGHTQKIAVANNAIVNEIQKRGVERERGGEWGERGGKKGEGDGWRENKML